ncbi:M48 family metallopeptidase [bacterium]|nr:M48 family metallopeptidase [bacterium]
MMKKIFILFFISVLMFSLSAFAATETTWTDNASVNRVNTIGKNLLSKNNLPTNITFKVIETDEINAYANGDNELCVFTGLLKYVTDDSELAGVIAHEIGHILNSHVAKQSIFNAVSATLINNININQNVKNVAAIGQNLSMKKMSRNEENEADITAVDLMVKAGYNPLAMVSVLYKISGNYVDILEDHPSGDKRTMYIYDYITYTYPEKAKLGYNSDSYKQFMAYATPIVNERNSNKSKLDKFNKEQEKLKTQRIKKLQKYQNTTNEFGWKASYTLLKAISQ